MHEPEPSEELQALALEQSERYREGGLLGRGGMGEIRTVYDARLGRAVALKTPVARDDETTRRFVVEATLTARLVHPGIVAVHDAGLGEGGRPYYTMPIVQGRSLAAAIAESSPAERLRLVRHFLDACEAIAYAHSQALLHRDLKPANILVGRFGETIVVDWGLAGPIGEAASAGTPAYMPPEQVAGEPLDARADVYALGVTLREILSGSPLVEPPRGTPPELLAIIERACADDPGLRYPDGRALAEDVAAWFEGRRVAAHRYSAAELLARMWAAYRVPITIVLLAIVALAVAIGVGYRRTAIEREHAQASEREAIAARARAEDNLAQAEVAQSLVAAAESAWPQAELYAAGALQHGPSAAARGVLARFDTQSRARLLRRSPLPSCRRLVPSLDGTQVACSSKRGMLHFDVERPDAARELGLDGHPLALFEGERMIIVDGTRVLYVDAAHPRGHELAHATAGPSSESIGRDGRIGWVRGIGEHWLDIDSPDLRLLSDAWCIRLANAAPAALGLRDNGSRIVFCQDGSVLTEDVPGGPQRELMRLDPALGAPVFVTLSPGSRLAAISLASSELVVVDLVEARVLRSFGRLVGTPFALALTESRLALADGRGSVFVWEVASGALVVRLASAGRALRWLDASGTRLRSFGDTLEDWQLPDTLARPHVIPLGSGIAAISHDPRRARVLSAHGDGQLRLTQLDGTVPPLAIPLDASVAKDVEFSPDGARAIAVCAQRDVLFELELDTPEGPRVHELPSLAGPRVVWLADRRRIVGQYREGLVVSLGELGRPASLSGTPIGAVRDLDSSPDRSFALALLDDQLIRIDTEVHALRELDGQSVVLAAHRDGYVAARGRLIERLDGAGSTTLRIELPEAVLVTEAAISPDGRYLALGRFDGAIELRSFATLDLLALLQGHTSRVAALAFDASGTWLTSGGWDGELRQWSMHALERSPAQVRREAEAAWGLTLEQLLESDAS